VHTEMSVILLSSNTPVENVRRNLKRALFSLLDNFSYLFRALIFLLSFSDILSSSFPSFFLILICVAIKEKVTFDDNVPNTEPLFAHVCQNYKFL
jgi:hypothetical protein